MFCDGSHLQYLTQHVCLCAFINTETRLIPYRATSMAVGSWSCSNDPHSQFISEKSSAKISPLQCCQADRSLNRCACPDTFNRPVPEYSSPFLQKASVLKSRQTSFTYFVVKRNNTKRRWLKLTWWCYWCMLSSYISITLSCALYLNSLICYY